MDDSFYLVDLLKIFFTRTKDMSLLKLKSANKLAIKSEMLRFQGKRSQNYHFHSIRIAGGVRSKTESHAIAL